MRGAEADSDASNTGNSDGRKLARNSRGGAGAPRTLPARVRECLSDNRDLSVQKRAAERAFQR